MLYLHSVGHYHPPTVIDNAFLSSLDIGVDLAWVEERVGISERRTTLSLDYIRHTRNADPRAAVEGSTVSTADMAKEAAEHALRRAGLEAGVIKMVLAGGCCPERLIPAEASRLAAVLGIQAVALDVSAACASFAAQLHFLAQMRPETLPDYIMVCSVEAFTRSIDYADRRDAILFGDAASVAIVSPRIKSRFRIMNSSFNTDPSGHEQITIPAGGHFKQDGHRVQMFAIRKTVELLAACQNRENGRPHPEEIFIGHQANLRMLESVCKRLDIPAELHLTNVRQFGNCGAAGAPSVLSQNWNGLASCAVNLAVVGSGLSWGSIRICVGEADPN